MEKPKITVVGSINMDLVTEATKIPSLGETIMGENFSMIPGGKGANQAVAATRLGADVTLIGCVGKDAFGKELIKHLKYQGVNVDKVETITGVSTGTATITVANHDNSIIVVPGANHSLTPEKVEKNEEIIANSDVLLLQLEIPLDAIRRAVEIAHLYGVKIVLNPAPAQRLPKDIVDKIDYLTPNEHELTYFYEKENETLESIVKRVGEKFIITKGRDGVYFYRNGEVVHVPAYKVDVIDTTGAGDSFNGALAVALSQNASLEEACHYGNAVGAISVTKFGAQGGMPTKEEVEHFFQQRLRGDKS